MYDYITTNVAAAALLTTTFACFGLLAAWSALWRGHWFIRNAVVFAILSPLLFIPAYELFLPAALTATVTRNLLSGKPTFKPTLSLSSALLLTTTVAVGLGIAVHVPVEVWSAWPFWISIAMGLAFSYALLILLAGGWPRTWRFRALFVVIATALSAGFFVYCGSALMAEIGVTPFSAVFGLTSNTDYLFWTGVALGSNLFLLSIFWFVGSSIARRGTSMARPNVGTGRSLTNASLVIGIALFPAMALWELTHPLPIPHEVIPEPNRMVALYDFGKKLEGSAVEKQYQADVTDYELLAAAVTSQAADYDELDAALKIPGWIPSVYDMFSIDTENLMGRRRIGRLLQAKSEVAIRAKRVDDAIEAQLKLLHYGETIHQGGLAIDFLVATAIDQIAYRQIYDTISLFNAQQCRAIQLELAVADERRLGIDDVQYREHVFMQRSNGWFGHLTEFIQRLSTPRDSEWDVSDGVTVAHKRNQALARLLILKLAIRAYELEHKQLPTQLSQLQPAYIAALPIDPFDPTAQPLRYKVNGDIYILYSVAEDGVDDGGLIPARPRDLLGLDYKPRGGDLLLDEQYKPEPAAAAENSEDDGSSTL
jgi:hypothetical protein